MNAYKTQETHSDFKIRGQHFSNEELKEAAFSFIKEDEAYEAEIGRFLQDWLNEKAYVTVHTSGSTGKPKLIRLRKDAMINSAIATGDFFKVKNGTNALLCLPANYIAGKMMLVRAMVLGWDLDLVSPKANPLDHLYKLYDFCAMTPFQLDNSIGRLHLINKLIVGGGSVSENLKNLLQDKKAKVYETYGMTETITHIAARRINSKKAMERNENPFKLLPNVSISTDDRNCLVIQASKLSEEEVVTNDVVEIVSDNKFLWKGRLDNVINSGGIKIFPEEVERKLQKLISQRFFITSLPDDALGQKLVLFVEANFSEVEQKELFSKIKNLEMLDKYEKPKKIFFVEKFEETPTGKINRMNTVKGKSA
ncbi:MAG TPA: AMP-binding protein [Salinimicrobium sp.]|nr:AMP-binding protein [Salinimicrobium sp.]